MSPHRRLTVVSALAFFYPSNEQVTMTQQSHLPLCLHSISLIHLNLKLSAIFHPVSAAFLLHQFATSPRSIPTGLKKCFPYEKPTFPCTYLRFMSRSGWEEKGVKKMYTKIINLKYISDQTEKDK